VAVRIGVDVGGTFTKAVACRAATGEVLARAVVPTTQSSSLGTSEGVVVAVDRTAAEVRRAGLGPVLVVAHSSTQAVNALLEGDTATVGVLGIGRRPDLRRARRRTRVGKVRLAPGRSLATCHTFVDATPGPSHAEMASAVRGLVDRGAEALCVSEAFGVDDPTGERLALEAAAELGVPACAGHELSGLYGLELRTVTGALNASILPTSLAVAGLVEAALERSGTGAPLLVMRGDGGVSGLAAMRRRPLLTAFSGPAASVAGAVRHLAVRDAVVVEVGGTSTNISVVRAGRPVLAYVRVLEHVTCVRSLDVRVVGVAGGSLLRVARRRGRLRVVELGPRSAHIAGLAYSCFARPEDLDGARPVLLSPRPGDPPDYAVVESAGGRRFAPTLTCAANALGVVAPGSYAEGNRAAARRAFEALGSACGVGWEVVARRALELGSAQLARAVAEAAGEALARVPVLVGLGGGAGALAPAVASQMGLECRIPADAEVISSVGDALSPVRVEVEQSLSRPRPGAVSALHVRAERAAIEAGAAPDSVQVESEAVPERGAVRAVAVGAVALDREATGASCEADDESRRRSAEEALGEACCLVWDNGAYCVYATGRTPKLRWAIVDRRGALAGCGEGDVLVGAGGEVARRLEDLVPAMVRLFGPVAVAPAVRVLRGPRLVDLSLMRSAETTLAAARRECAGANGEAVAAFLSRG
jgi:N-methylhydantoinase A